MPETVHWSKLSELKIYPELLFGYINVSVFSGRAGAMSRASISRSENRVHIIYKELFSLGAHRVNPKGCKKQVGSCVRYRGRQLPHRLCRFRGELQNVLACLQLPVFRLSILCLAQRIGSNLRAFLQKRTVALQSTQWD